MFDNQLIVYFPQNVAVKEYRKLVNIWQK